MFTEEMKEMIASQLAMVATVDHEGNLTLDLNVPCVC